ncbi:MAG: hypothetical protein A2445_01230 [Candidatus Jacksonbacteria bacterium RIFOXYC2_FULL_44_29]|nr:MAG: hypothetical protein UW45_C0013G0009 [Parcubacteria group bacterium GW2011_GWC2_44_22]OGY74959.1 MAG: hypothetical protein A2240_05260 [Candidatus Jacksonbacteria bacterium RIFOXYA2_FULL_43_12]OGY76512.1 MAG: hypothetical protein A2295_02045 [Candidatus Jacksonbacteria bacterium RIFOXYB2_FULL_44_15]OGY78492.1 MAG: hypothetical protein A2445_01230 [Candidatus Jacksonbacteria bacterium RIFOXYC2_FULL_44_29]OGY81149.1 MAG: hypothetical protein A2550_01625 [Candidatus Jacksonbacteria bacteri
MFQSLKHLLPATLSKYKIASATEATLICNAVNQKIEEILKNQATNTKAVYLKDGQIAIQSDSAMLIAELQTYRDAILEDLRRDFPKTQIKSIRFLIA